MFATMDIRLLTAADAESFWHLRLEALRNDPASFADSAEEHLKTRVEMVKEILGKSDPASNFVVGVFEEGKLTATAGFTATRTLKNATKDISGAFTCGRNRAAKARPAN